MAEVIKNGAIDICKTVWDGVYQRRSCLGARLNMRTVRSIWTPLRVSPTYK